MPKPRSRGGSQQQFVLRVLLAIVGIAILLSFVGLIATGPLGKFLQTQILPPIIPIPEPSYAQCNKPVQKKVDVGSIRYTGQESLSSVEASSPAAARQNLKQRATAEAEQALEFRCRFDRERVDQVAKELAKEKCPDAKCCMVDPRPKDSDGNSTVTCDFDTSKVKIDDILEDHEISVSSTSTGKWQAKIGNGAAVYSAPNGCTCSRQCISVVPFDEVSNPSAECKASTGTFYTNYESFETSNPGDITAVNLKEELTTQYLQTRGQNCESLYDSKLKCNELYCTEGTSDWQADAKCINAMTSADQSKIRGLCRLICKGSKMCIPRDPILTIIADHHVVEGTAMPGVAPIKVPVQAWLSEPAGVEVSIFIKARELTLEERTRLRLKLASKEADFAAVKGRLTIPAGDVLSNIIEIPIVGDSLEEDNEAFGIELSDVRGKVELQEENPRVIEILDDDGDDALTNDENPTPGDDSLEP